MSARRNIAAVSALGLLASGGATISGASFVSSSANPKNVITSSVDFVAPQGTLSVPAGTLRGTVTLTATATDVGTGVASVRFERAAGDSAEWTTICTDTSSPYACALDTTGLADGAHRFRVVVTDGAGNTATSAVVGPRTVDNAAPVVALDELPGDVRGTVTIGATASDAGTGVTSVRIERRAADSTGAWTEVCTDTTAPYGCAWSTTGVANDLYDLRAIATDGAGNATTSAVDSVQVDNAAPTVSLTVPAGTLAGTVTLTAAADDIDSGVDRVTIQRQALGATTWTDICVVSTSPYSCRFATPEVPDGSYSFRAVAVDAAGNSATSTPVSRTILNSATNTVSMEDPGELLRGTVTLQASANATAGVASVRIERAPSGTSTWTPVCTDATAPYTCAFDTAAGATPDGLYDFRAIMTPAVGSPVTSAVVTQRRIDNAPVRGFDVQGANRAGGRAGRIESGDALVLTYGTEMKASTLIPGWSGTSSIPVVFQAADRGNVETLTVSTTGTGATATGLGSVVTQGNYVKNNKTATFSATATLSTDANGRSSVAIVLGAQTGGGTVLRTVSSLTALKWTPSATATNLNGVAASTAPVTEGGTADRDF